jgi:hypothetical protein
VDSKGIFLRHAKGLTIRDNSDKVRGYHSYLCHINLMDSIKISHSKTVGILIFCPIKKEGVIGKDST